MKHLLLFAATTVSILTTKAFAQTERFLVNLKSSSVEWIAGKVTGQHSGTVHLKSGFLDFEGAAIKNGAFEMDMKSMAVTDIKGSSAANLLNHLQGEDFFFVSKHPVSNFQITQISSTGPNSANITGNLTIKGITNTITFPATVKRQKNAVVAVAKGIKVDRTKYDIKYRSKSFFGDIGDKAIDDEFVLNVNLVAKR